ncbi:flagellar basal body rod protein FlgB [Falsiroseomonas ponticola]|uniref:flagellar basal body rod protein FlgB n=1 Tax=Falsiroseomonas ponticola TaxID=2786951 RepID=UPI00193235F8|nr:flagellar biosynthesis protein FlgB [Roseomonas ponticola]
MDVTGTSTRRPAGGGHDVLALAQRRLAWLDRRTVVLAQNIANADTPAYRPRDVVPFAQVLSAAGAPPLARTSPAHLRGTGQATAGTAQDRALAETAPDGNAVSLDREAVRVAETDTAHALAMAVHRSVMGMVRLALGRQG